MKNLLTPPVQKIMAALSGEGEARIVGGAVRDALMQRPIGDIDMATTILPQRVMEILTAHQIKCVPTGLAHGTITAVVDHTGYEITTLRRDVTTDGRHAIVEFTDDWQQDAARRDFTMNAMYVDANGKLYDYFNGETAAKQGQVHFIGDATARINEDVLRILRFFRFYAWFGQQPIDANGFNACRASAHLIPTLSAERVAKEILKLLTSPNPYITWQLMIEGGIVAQTIPTATNLPRLQTLLTNENTHGEKPNGLLRLAALLPENDATTTATKLKLSNRDTEKLTATAKLPALLHNNLAPKQLRAILYRHGAENTRAALLLLDQDITAALATIANWENPVFPIRGEDLLKSGIPAGKQIGDILANTENYWIDNDFRPTRADCLDHAAQYGKNH